MVEQGSKEWLELRRGKVTASCITDVMAKGKGNAPSVTRQKYMCKLVTERLTKTVEETYISRDMELGNEHEAQARDGYSFYKDVDVEQVDFVDHPTIKMAGASPDGLVGENGLIETKCPKDKTHIITLVEAMESLSVPREYNFQMQWQMACAGREWCDYVSFDPRLDPALQLVTQRVMRDEELIKELETAVIKFLEELDGMMKKIETEYSKKRQVNG